MEDQFTSEVLVDLWEFVRTNGIAEDTAWRLSDQGLMRLAIVDAEIDDQVLQFYCASLSHRSLAALLATISAGSEARISLALAANKMSQDASSMRRILLAKRYVQHLMANGDRERLTQLYRSPCAYPELAKYFIRSVNAPIRSDREQEPDVADHIITMLAFHNVCKIPGFSEDVTGAYEMQKRAWRVR